MQKQSHKIYIVAGLHYGDEGKGSIVDYLARIKQARLVVRYGGGPQAAHHVVLPNSSWHCFSHYGSGMFVNKCDSVICKYMLVYPQTLVQESETLMSKGASKVITRLHIDLECFIITPYHQLVSRIMEIFRSRKKGSTGLGVGLTVQEAYGTHKQFFPKMAQYSNKIATTLQVKDLLKQEIYIEKLNKIYQQKTQFISSLIKMSNQQLNNFIHSAQERKLFGINTQIAQDTKRLVLQELISFTNKDSRNSLVNCLAFYKKFIQDYKGCFKDVTEVIKKTVKNHNVIFQGSQGALLDPIDGFFPHITKTLCSDENAVQIIKSLNFPVEYVKIGVLRAYSHRHGAGPFITQNTKLGQSLPELHNKFSVWQGNFKVGVFDIVAAKYGLAIFKPDYIAVTCLDRALDHKIMGQYCASYVIEKKIQPLLQDLIQKYTQHELSEQSIVIKSFKKLQSRKPKTYDLLQIVENCRAQYAKLELNQNKKYIILQKYEKYGKIVNSFISLLEKELNTSVTILSYSETWKGKFQIRQI